ncbi:lysis protein [Lelliottia wanjuensis]|uniref:Lysis protein n=1 Tax=Lelliottia wanjuensis TaxID=3050585 RepID=A0AAP4FX89_9ENTR|nr:MULTISPECIES: lysis protein [unclassified Lelliottia]MDK9365347.1 lysis protein [Lelliottia sp. V106_12]MDK9617880.1 lysis protein [Lelliottia sp. V106_9]
MLWKTVVTHWKAILILLLIIWVAAAGKIADHYHDKYKKASDDLALAKATITDMTTRQRDVAALDAKYTQELADAQENINQLERDVANGKRRLQLNATCKSNATGTTGMDDVASARLTDSAERDYFTLRQRIETVTKQLTGLQEYVRTQCLK